MTSQKPRGTAQNVENNNTSSVDGFWLWSLLSYGFWLNLLRYDTIYLHALKKLTHGTKKTEK